MAAVEELRRDERASAHTLPLLYEGWRCTRLELRGEDELRARFGAQGTADFVEIQIVRKGADGVGTVAVELDRCAVRYRASVGALDTAGRDRVRALIMGTANAVEARLAASPGATFAQAFGRATRTGAVMLSPPVVRELLAPDIVEGVELLDGWRLVGIAPEREPLAGNDHAAWIAVRFEHGPSGQKLRLRVGGRQEGRRELARSAHLSLTYMPFDDAAAPSADTICTLVTFLLQVRDHDGLDLRIPHTPKHASHDAPDDADAVLARLRGELTKKRLACIRPWVTAERQGSWQVLPCCQRFLRPEVLAECDPNVESLREGWNSPGLQAVRRAMAAGRPHDTCKEDCPQFHGPSDVRDDWLFDKPASKAAYDNLVLVLNEMIQGVEQVESIPLHVQVAVEEDCNIRCVMCSITTKEPGRQGGGRVLEPDEADELVSFIPSLRGLSFIGGEPTMAPLTREILSRLDVVEYPDITAQMITNGLLLSPKYTEALRHARLELMVSVNAATPETFERITGRRGGFEVVMRNVRALLAPDAGFAVPPAVTLSFVVMKDNYREVPAFLQIAAELGCAIRLQAVYGELGGQSIFTDETLLREVGDYFERDVLPGMEAFPPQFGHSARRIAHMIQSRLERRDFTPY